MAQKDTFYSYIHKLREQQTAPVQRVVLALYFNQEELKKTNISLEQYTRESLLTHKTLSSYLYLKGTFAIHLIESPKTNDINSYLLDYHRKTLSKPALFNVIRVVYQSYENPTPLLRGFECDQNPQPGPILSETQKTEEQIQDRSFEIYDLFVQGARKKRQNPSHKIGNMIVLSNDDMSMLISSNFMSLEQYLQVYTGTQGVEKEQQLNYPFGASFFQVMEFLQVQNYEQYRVQ